MTIKRAYAFAAAVMMAVAMTGCGSVDETSAKSDGSNGAAVADVKTDEKADAAEGHDEALNGDAEAPEATEETAAAEEDTAAAIAGDDAGFGLMEEKGMIAEDREFMATDGVSELEAAGDRDVAVVTPDDLPEDPVITNDGEAFVLTAGEWNDNENWGFFTNLIKNGTIKFPVFGLDPSNRIEVTVTKDGAPAANQAVELLDGDGNVIWSAMSDKNGMAYVFYTTNDSPAQVRCGSSVQEVVAGTEGEQGKSGTEEAALEAGDSKTFDKTEVMFILDTTGSMYDEIAYLQMDFSSIAEEVGDGNTTFSVNFYRDDGDDYVTKTNPFTDDVKSIQKLINKEDADGGGDLPEAVDKILDETITNGQWSTESNKIAFLIFDAPPHEGREETLMTAVKAAAKKGIHLVPVVASNSDRDTELFGRAVAAYTNSNYVFLTDDSGIGGEHLEPIIGDYEVELLHDIIVRNINEIKGQ